MDKRSNVIPPTQVGRDEELYFDYEYNTPDLAPLRHSPRVVPSVSFELTWCPLSWGHVLLVTMGT